MHACSSAGFSGLQRVSRQGLSQRKPRMPQVQSRDIVGAGIFHLPLTGPLQAQPVPHWVPPAVTVVSPGVESPPFFPVHRAQVRGPGPSSCILSSSVPWKGPGFSSWPYARVALGGICLPSWSRGGLSPWAPSCRVSALVPGAQRCRVQRLGGKEGNMGSLCPLSVLPSLLGSCQAL